MLREHFIADLRKDRVRGSRHVAIIGQAENGGFTQQDQPGIDHRGF